MSDSKIIKQLKQGNETAFKNMVERYQKPVINICYGLLQNREDAEDIAQDIFIEVFRKIQDFREDSKLSTWLYRIAVNRSLNHIRDHKKHRWFRSFDDEVSEKSKKFLQVEVAKSDQPEYKLENQQRALILKEAINCLPKNQKVAFILCKYEDLSYQEIAEVMELSVSSVESLLFRAKKGLQRKLYQCYKKSSI